MKKLIIFNWKMAPKSLGEAKRLLTYNLQLTTNNKNTEVVVCPPFIYLFEFSLVVGRRSLVKLGAQDIFWENSAGGGAYTGEISPAMLKDLGVEYVIIGHSERRKYLNETDEIINKKVLTALKAGLKVILCVGEPKRESGSRNYELGKAKNYIKKQLKKDLENISSMSHVSLSKSLIVAYEPIWAIGGNHSDTPQDAVEMIKFIKSLVVGRWSLVVPVLYGGSVDSKNIADFLKHPEINGALVGHASLKAREVGKIIENILK